MEKFSYENQYLVDGGFAAWDSLGNGKIGLKQELFHGNWFLGI